jgi:hypothetical protein
MSDERSKNNGVKSVKFGPLPGKPKWTPPKTQEPIKMASGTPDKQLTMLQHGCTESQLQDWLDRVGYHVAQSEFPEGANWFRSNPAYTDLLEELPAMPDKNRKHTVENPLYVEGNEEGVEPVIEVYFYPRGGNNHLTDVGQRLYDSDCHRWQKTAERWDARNEQLKKWNQATSKLMFKWTEREVINFLNRQPQVGPDIDLSTDVQGSVVCVCALRVRYQRVSLVSLGLHTTKTLHHT